MALILVFDVNLKRLKNVCVALEPHGVISCDNLNQAVRESVTQRPDLIISDWDESDGAKLIMELGRVPDFTVPPVCFMDTVYEPQDVKKLRFGAYRRGAIGFIPRPIARAVLASYISAMLYRVRMLGFFPRPVEPIERRALVEGDPVKMTLRILSEPAQSLAKTAAVNRLATNPPQLRLVTFEEGDWPEQSSN